MIKAKRNQAFSNTFLEVVYAQFHLNMLLSRRTINYYSLQPVLPFLAI